MLLSNRGYFWDFMQAPPFVPQAYWDAVSNEQRIKFLFIKLYRLCEYVEKLSKDLDEVSAEIITLREDFENFEKQILQKIDEFEADFTIEILNLLEALEEKLLNSIAEMQKNPGWDVEKGQATDSKDAMRILRKELPFQARKITKRGKMRFTELCAAHSITVDDLKQNYIWTGKIYPNNYAKLPYTDTTNKEISVLDLSTISGVVAGQIKMWKDYTSLGGDDLLIVKKYAENWINCGKYISVGLEKNERITAERPAQLYEIYELNY